MEITGYEMFTFSHFRVYTTFGDVDQATLVYDSKNGKLKGAVMGSFLGALRTGSIGAVSTRYMTNHNADIMGLLEAEIRLSHRR